jgi:imidazolonepropionase-like amidohydrolase
VDPGETADSAKPTEEERGETFLLRGARVMTAAGAIYDEGDVLVRDGAIAAVGVAIEAPEGARIIDVKGKTITPGIIDTHSHLGVYASPGLPAHRDGNEAVAPVTAYARAADGYWPQDPQIDYARAGGVTTAQILPGSANLIGGRSLTVKLTPGARSAEDARFPGAPEGLKMACGENPKRVYGEKGGPQTRMGNVAGYRRAFLEAQEYSKRWKHYEKKVEDWKSGNGGDQRPDPPGRDLGLETLAKVLDGKILVHNHCYRADEMSLMLDLAESFGFQIRSFHHAVEAYKIADRLAEAGTGASVWADWWGFKAEAYDGVRENAAMISAAGARAIIHSDSAVGIQRLNQEAAKAMSSGKRAGIEISEDEALKWITVNPAWALGIEGRTGSLEIGKMADIVIWNGTPFSVYAKAEAVYIDGELVYDRRDPAHQPRTDFDVGLRDDVRGGR